MAPGVDEVPEFMDDSLKHIQVDVISTWRDYQPQKRSGSMNTDPLKVSNASIQTVERETEGTQTEDAPQPTTKPSKKAEAGLPSFVTRAAELVQEEFVRVAEEHEALEPLGRGESETVEPATCIFELTPFQGPSSSASMPPSSLLPSSSFTDRPSAATQSRLGGKPKDMQEASQATPQQPSNPHAKLVVTSLSWSSTGQTVAASYGRYDVAGWCSDRGALVAWNLGRSGLSPTKPDTLIDVDVCLMACAFHPEHPALIAGGTFNGDLFVWDLSQEGDPQRGRSDPLCDVRHQEPIQSICWQYSLTEAGKYGNRAQAYRLVTLGADGRVLVWVWHKLAIPLYGYQLLWPAPGADRKILWGGTSMSFAIEGLAARSGGQSSKSEGGAAAAGVGAATFMIGTEGGRLFRCYYDVNDMAARDFQKALAGAEGGGTSGSIPELRCPIKDASYAPHAGAVYGVSCSPFNRDLFLSAGADGSVRLYHTLKQQPLLTLEPSAAQLYGVQWSTARPLVFAAPAGDGRVYLYDLGRARDIVRPVASLDASPGGGPVYACAFNARKPEYFASGDSTSIQIWKLPDALSASRKGEAAALRKLAAADDAGEAMRALARRGGQ